MPEAREVVVEGRLDDVVHVGDLPLQVGALPDVALKREVVHLLKTRCTVCGIVNKHRLDGRLHQQKEPPRAPRGINTTRLHRSKHIRA